MENIENNPEQAPDIFSLDAASFVNPPKKGASEIYSPQADNGKDGVYSAVIRFLPWYKNPNNSKIQKFVVWLVDPTEEKGMLVDCPSSVGKKSILKDTYWKLKNSTSAKEAEYAEKFSRTGYYYSLVQIVEDNHTPDLVGKIMVFKFGVKVNEKIEAQLKPVRGAAVNPYDLFEGKDFILSIVKKQKWNNYDGCAFSNDKTPITLPGETTPISKTPEDMERTKKWLVAESPDLSKYEYKDWSAETTERVMKAIRNILPDGRLAEQVLSAASKSADAGGFDVAEPVKATTSASLQSEAKTHVPANEKPAAAPVTGISGLDDLYDGL